VAVKKPSGKPRRHGRRRDQYHTPWIAREVAGAPVWAMIIVGCLVIGIAIAAALQ